nr:MAG TPA: Large Terminase [Bacteriophage sp.]
MSFKVPDVIEEYLKIIEEGQYRVCKEQKALAEYVRKVFKEEPIVFDEEKAKRYIGIAKYFPFKELFAWEKFIIALWNCVYKIDGMPRWKTLFVMVGRGAGKDGLIAVDSLASISPYNSVAHYDVDICANNEEQAKRPVMDIIEALENPAYETKLNKFFYHTKEVVQGRKNKGCIKGRTNNPKGRDGMRSGKTIFNEVHAYQNYDNIKVFITGQGKVAQPRVGIFTSNGEISDGPLDDYLLRSQRILFEEETDNGFLPFICRLEKKEQVHDKQNWYMANPSLQYMPHLLQETEDEYKEWLDHPEQNADFLTKRMGIRTSAKEIILTDYENILATNKPIPKVEKQSCIAGIDYAELSDWAAVNLHFKQGDYRIDINHAWLCTQSKTLYRVKAPWQEWARQGHITVVDDVGIHPDILAEYIAEAMKIYNIKMIALDNYRFALISNSLAKIGFEPKDRKNVKLIRPSDIMKVEPIVQECFNRKLFIWGNNPCLRWGANNTKRVRASRNIGSDTGNFIYAKIEAKSRKNDPFMSVVASMTCEDELSAERAIELPPIGAFSL